MALTIAPGMPGNWGREVLLGFAVTFLSIGGFVGWAATVRLDAAVIASGSIGVETDRKLLQHLEGGTIQEILVSDGDRVKEGDVLLKIDPVQSRAAATIAYTQMMQALGDKARFAAQAQGADHIDFPAELQVNDPLISSIIEDEKRQFDDMRRSQTNEIDMLNRKQTENKLQIDGIMQQIMATHAQISSIDDELAKIEPLIVKRLINASRKSMLERTRNELVGHAGSLDADAARLAETGESIKIQVDQVGRKSIELAGSKLSEADIRLGEAREKLSVQTDSVRRAELRAPRSGRIVNMKAHTIGAVVRPGETIAEIVPDQDRLVITVHMAPVDVAHVWPGLRAEVRLPSFHSQKLPIVLGDVLSVSADVLDDPKHGPYYEVKVSVEATAFPEDLRAKLRPGMPADILVATGERTALQYLVQPLADAMHMGMREN